MLPKQPRIIIIGAGFAGMEALKKLGRVKAEIVLIDRHNYHTFIPLLYQVATGFIAPQAVTYPIRKRLRSISNARFIQAEVQQLDLQQKTVITDSIRLDYDYLVLATGSMTNFLGVAGADKFGLPMRTLRDAVRIRDRLIGNFERAAVCLDPALSEQLLTIVIVGGGATGVELAGSIQDLVAGTLDRDYPTITGTVKVILLHSGTALMADYPQQLGEYTARQLRRRGVKVHLRSRVQEILPDAVKLEDGTVIESGTIIWTAGVEADYPQDPLPKSEFATATKNKLCVKPTLQLAGYVEVYAMGDVALVKQDGEALLGIAPEALQQGKAVARNLKRQLRGLEPQPFNYFNKGKAAIIARNSGIAYLFGKIPLQGFAAWLLWLGIHLYYLPGMANRIIVLGSWLRDYLTKERDRRQIIGKL